MAELAKIHWETRDTKSVDRPCLGCHLAKHIDNWVQQAWTRQLLAQGIYTSLDSFPLLAAPLFILAGGLMEPGGISLRITHSATAIIGQVRGGLAW